MGEIQLDGGWLPIVVFVMAPLAIVLALGWRTGAWKWQLAVGVPVAVIGGLLVYAAESHFDLIPYAFPNVFYVWVAVVIFAVTIAIVGWRRDHWAQRIVSVFAVVAAVALLGVAVNNHYSYYPTVANLFGKTSDNTSDLPGLTAVREEARRSGQMPDKGIVVPIDIPTTNSGFTPRQSAAYLPPVWFTDPQPDLPVLLMLPGVPGSPNDWLVGGKLEETANAFAAQNGGRTPVLVTVDFDGQGTNDTQCVDGKRGNAETYITRDVLPYVQSTFSTATTKEQTGILGLSAGGFCSLMLPLRHPDLFTVSGVYSSLDRPSLDPPGVVLTDVFGGDQAALDAHDPTLLLKERQYPGMAMWFEVGSEDPATLQATQEVSRLTADAGIETCLQVRPGAHNFEFWSQAFRESLPWLSDRLGLRPTAGPSPVPCSKP
jgi:S-formylglutathione hydrolase FrmB